MTKQDKANKKSAPGTSGPEQTQTTVSEIETLYKVSALFNSSTSLDEVVQAIALPGVETGASSAVLFTFESDEAGQPEWSQAVAAWTKEESSDQRVGARYFLPDYPFARLWLSDPGNPLLVDDVASDDRVDPATRNLFLEENTVSVAVLPLTLGERWVGLVMINWDKSHSFTTGDQRLYSSLASQAAVVVHNRLLFEQTRKRAAQLERLSEFGAALTRADDETEILSALALLEDMTQDARMTLSYVEVDRRGEPVAAHTVASWQDGVVEKNGAGQNGEAIQLRSLPAAALWLNRPNSVLFIEDLLTDPRIDESGWTNATQQEIRAMAVIPLHSGNRWHGYLTLSWPTPRVFTADERLTLRRLLEPLAAVVASRRAYLDQREATNFLDSIIERIPMALFVKDASDLRFVRWNRASEEMFGFSREIMIGKNDYDFFPEEEADFFVAKDREVLSSGEPLDIPEESIETPHRGTRLLHTIKTPIFGTDGQPRYLLAVSEDITERKQAAEELARQRSTLQAVLDNMPAGVFVVEVPSGKPLLTNERATALLGRGTAPEATAEELGEVYDAYRYGTDELYPSDQMPLVRGMAGETTTVEDMEIRRPDGTSVPIQVFGGPIRDAAGNVTASVAIFQDISERKQAELLLAKRAAELEAVAQLSTAASSILETDRLLQEVVDMTRSSFGLYHAHIYLLDEEESSLELAAGAGEVGRQMVEKGWHISLDQEQSLVARAARSRQGVIVNDVHQEPGWLPNPLLPDTQAEMAVPMLAGDQVVGVLDVQAAEVGRFTEEDVRIKTTLASQVGVALQNARLYQQTQSTLAETERLYTAAQAISAVGSEQEIVAALVEHLDRSRLDRVTVALLDETQEGRLVGQVKGMWDRFGQEQVLLGKQFTPDEIPLIEQLGPEQTLLIDDYATSDQIDEVTRAMYKEFGVKSAAIIPISAGQRHLGWLFLETIEAPRHFAAEEIRPYMTLANQAAVAIQTARLFQQTQARVRREQTLRQVTARVHATSDVDSLMRAAVQEVGRVLGRQAFVYLDRQDQPATVETLKEQ